MSVGDRLNRKREARAPESAELGGLQLAHHYRDRLLQEADLAELTALGSE